MRNDDQLILLHLAPAAQVTVAQLDKIYGPVVLGRGWRILYFALGVVDLNEGARLQQRIKRVIRQSDEAILHGPKLQVLDQRDRHVSPYLHHARQQRSAIDIE